MSYLAVKYIKDIHVKDLYNKLDATGKTEAMEELDSQIENFANIKGVLVDNIDVDVSGNISNINLINFAVYTLYIKLLTDYWGSSGIPNDIYFDKIEMYEKKLKTIESIDGEFFTDAEQDIGTYAEFNSIPVL